MSLIKAADDARRLLRGFKAFEEVAAALEQVGTLEQRAAEANKVLADLGPQIEAAKAEVSQAELRAASLLADAQVRAEQIGAAAAARANTMVSDAETAAQNIVLAAEQTKAKAEDARAAASLEAAEAIAKRDQVAAEVKELEARADKARKYLAKLAD